MTIRTKSRTRSRPRARSPARAAAFDAPELDAAIAAAEATAVVVRRGERIAFADLPIRIARTDDRGERDALYTGWIEALEAINPHYEARLAHWREQARAAGHDDLSAAVSGGPDRQAPAVELERLTLHSETVYYAALRRYLAVVDIEQGDATLADLWHIERGGGWSHWFGGRELARAVGDTGRAMADPGLHEGWRSAESRLAGPRAAEDSPATRAIGELYASLVGDPTWLGRALRMAPDEVAAFADFAAFIRVWRIRNLLGLAQFELRLLRTDDVALNRAYYAGIVGHITGIDVPEAAFLRDVRLPGSSTGDIEQTILVGAMAEVLEHRFGRAWWADHEARSLVAELSRATSSADALAQLGYDALDWRPLLRQIRTRLIGEMSGYGGPNITTRAGTRKV